MSKNYTEYVRSEVQKVSPAGFIILGSITLIAMIRAILKHEFQELSSTIKPNAAVFLLSSALTLIILVCYLIGRKNSIASEFVSQLFTLCFVLFCIPTFYEHPKDAQVIKS